MKRIQVKTVTATTVPGFENTNGQIVVRDTGFASETFPGQRIYQLRCRHCGHIYGSNGTDVFKRLCPAPPGRCPGERLRDPGPGLFDNLKRRDDP